MVWQIVNQVDIESAQKIALSSRSPFIEFKAHHSKEFIDRTRAQATQGYRVTSFEIKINHRIHIVTTSLSNRTSLL